MTVNKWVLTAIILVLVVAGLVFFFVNRSSVGAVSIGLDSAVQAQVNQDLNQVVNPHIANADKALAAAQQIASNSVSSVKAEVLAVGKRSSGWELAEVNSAKPSIELNERVSVFQAIKVGRPAVLPVVGDQISFPMFSGNSVVVDVQSVKTYQDGGFSWSGHLQGFGDDYPVVVTYGERSAFATITTPEGSYTMESTDGLGWLYKNPSEFELSTHGSTDVLEIPEAH
jgi:hypothetical protein